MNTLDRVRDAVQVLRNIPDTAQHVHAACLEIFYQSGFDVHPEYRVALADGSYGRLDIMLVEMDGETRVAIEIDARKPRRGSIRKLRTHQRHFGGYTVAICRGVIPRQVEGLDLVVAVHVRQATDAEIADKSVVGRWATRKSIKDTLGVEVAA